MATPRGLACLFSGLLAVSCRGCGEDKPYTPFGVTTALPAATASAGASATPSASAAGTENPPSKALVAPAGARRWLLGGQEVAAPDGFAFSLAVPFGDTGEDHAVWLVAVDADGGSAPGGELWSFPKAGGPRRLVPLPGFVPTSPGCSLVANLMRSGPTTVTLDVAARCVSAMIARSASRAIVVVSPGSERAELLTLRIAEPAPDETLELFSTTTDRDQDGRDDMALTVRVGAPAPRAEAPLIWLDRALGPSRDASEPRRTLERLAAREVTRAKAKKSAEDALAQVTALRRLTATLCGEGATQRVFAGDGSPLACGSLGTAMDALLDAELSARLTLGQVREAFGALARDGWYFAKAGDATRKRLERALLDRIEPVSAKVTALDVRPLAGPTSFASPLEFSQEGVLTVRTNEGVTRFEPNGTATPVVPPEPLPPLDVRAGGRLFTGAVFSCDRSEVTLGFDAGPPQKTALLSPRPGACGRTVFAPGVTPRAVAAGTGLLALVGPTLVGDAGAGAATTAGSPRSADGRWLVVPTPFGLLIDGGAHRLLDLARAAEPALLTGCVVANGGTRAACIDRGRVLLIESGT